MDRIAAGMLSLHFEKGNAKPTRRKSLWAKPNMEVAGPEAKGKIANANLMYVGLLRYIKSTFAEVSA